MQPHLVANRCFFLYHREISPLRTKSSRRGAPRPGSSSEIRDREEVFPSSTFSIIAKNPPPGRFATGKESDKTGETIDDRTRQAGAGVLSSDSCPGFFLGNTNSAMSKDARLQSDPLAFPGNTLTVNLAQHRDTDLERPLSVAQPDERLAPFPDAVDEILQLQ